MAISDKEIDDKRSRVEKLREQVAAEEAKRTQREADSVNDIAAAQLDAEAARLEARLQAAKDSNKVAAVKEGVSGPLGAAQDDLANAEAVAAAQEEAKRYAAEEAERQKAAAAAEAEKQKEA